MSDPIDVSIVIVTFNDDAVIARCIAAAKQGALAHNAEILVVDNASNDATLERVENAANDVIIIPLQRNEGFAKATNVALRRAQGRIVAFVNSDAFIDSGSVDRLIARLQADDRIGIVGGVLRDVAGTRQPSAGRFPTLPGNLAVALLLHRLPLLSRLPTSVLADPRHYREAHRVDWVSGAFCVARREVGPLPALGFMYGEDVEWARQAQERGYQTWLEPQAGAVHLGDSGPPARRPLGSRQRRRVDFELRWFGPRGPRAAAARAVMVLHACVRILLFVGLLPVRPAVARQGVNESRALLGAAISARPSRPRPD
jgi:GT2 family glycosyltransferase